MLLIDTHCHLDEEALISDLDAVLKNASENGVRSIVTIGITAESSRQAIQLAETHDNIYATVGIHPNYVSQAEPGDWEVIEELALHPQVVALGETGLDRYWDYAPIEQQQEYFLKHIELSEKTGKPFVIHCRDADDEVRAILRETTQKPINAVMHSFCQSAEAASECIELGLHLSFTGMLTFKRNSELREVAGNLPKDRLFVETDAPYLAPTPFRGKRNEPAFVKHTLEVLAECHGVSAEEMAAQTTANACRFFGIPE
jgi:TatD DNase family protein